MGERDNVISFPGERRIDGGRVDPQLTLAVKGVRDFMGIGMEFGVQSHDVVVDSTLDSYDPFIVENGTMVMGSAGVEDFQKLFDSVEGIDPLELLVVYRATRDGLSMRNNKGNVPIPEKLRAFTQEIKPQLAANSKSRTNQAQLESTAIGVAAARMALFRFEPNRSSPQSKIMLPLEVGSIAQNTLRRRGVKLPETHKADRKRILGHFAVDIGETERGIIMDLLRASRAS